MRPHPPEAKTLIGPIGEKDSHRWLAAYQDASDIAALLPGTRIVSVARPGG